MIDDRSPKGPSGNGHDSGDRDARGRFRPGHSLPGPGNPAGKRVEQLRHALLSAVTTDDIVAIVRSLVKSARAGDVYAARLLLSYTLGRPLEADVLDRVAELEQRLVELTAGEGAA